MVVSFPTFAPWMWLADFIERWEKGSSLIANRHEHLFWGESSYTTTANFITSSESTEHGVAFFDRMQSVVPIRHS